MVWHWTELVRMPLLGRLEAVLKALHKDSRDGIKGHIIVLKALINKNK